MNEEELEDNLDLAIEIHTDNKDCLACIYWQRGSFIEPCFSCDQRCYFEQDIELQIMKNITNFDEGYK